ncbi:MAG: lysylphosphatidylglycerol synthase transmembrane domain-containing protein [Deltaproteobacteria bacterium]
MKEPKHSGRTWNWKLWIGLLISAVFVYLALRELDFARMWGVIRSADALLFLVVAAITFSQQVIRSWRWAILLEPIKKTTFSHRLSSTMIGFAANCVLPARLGEFVRANYLGLAENISTSSTLGTIVVERLFDGFTLLLILLIGLIGTPFPNEWNSLASSLRATGFFLLFLYILIILFLIGFKYKTKPFLSLLDRLHFLVPLQFRAKIMDTIWNFSLGLVLMKRPSRWLLVIFFSCLLWFSSLCQIQLVQYSIHLSLPFAAPFLIMAMASFGVMIPSAPGFIGTFHLSVQYAFLLYGVPKEEALSAAILWHAGFFFPTIILGFASFLIVHKPVDAVTGEPTTLPE